MGEKIILMGYMGCGKSVISKALSEKLKIKAIDLDDFIAEQEGKNIPEIFKKKGEVYFRKKETLYLEHLLKNPEKIIVALGGGTPCFAGNMNLIKQKNCKSFYLKASAETLFERLKKEKNKRPLIKDIPEKDLKTFIKKHLWERDFFYNKAEYCIKIDGFSVAEIMKNEILKL